MRHSIGFNAILITTIALAGAMAGAPGLAWAGPNREVEAANALYRAGNFQEALNAYDQLASERPDSAELQFNRGAAYYQMGDLNKAKEAFEEAGELAKDSSIQALSSYNLGNCAFKEGQDKAAEKPEEALTALDKSLGYYKDALARDKSLDAAAHNLEMAKRTIQDIRQQMREQEKQQQEQQKQDQQKKDEQKQKLDKLIQDQEQQKQQSEQAAQQQEQQKQDPAQPAPTPEQMQQMADQQQQTRKETEDLAEQMKPEDASKPQQQQDAQSKAAEAAEKQKAAEEQLKNQNPDEASKAQQEAVDKLKEARKALDEDGDKKDDQNSSSGQQQSPPNQNNDQKSAEDTKNPQDQQQQDGQPKAEDQKDGQKAAEQQKAPQDQKPQDEQKNSGAEQQDNVPPPDATAKGILNQEKQNKEQRSLQRMVRLRPVEKDW